MPPPQMVRMEGWVLWGTSAASLLLPALLPMLQLTSGKWGAKGPLEIRTVQTWGMDILSWAFPSPASLYPC